MLLAARVNEPGTRRELVLRLFRSFTNLGVDLESVLPRLGLKADELTGLPERVHPAAMHAIWEAAVAASGRGGLGLEIAEQVRLEHYDIVGSVIANSPTVGDAVVNLVRLFRLLSTTENLSLEIEADRARLVVEPSRFHCLHPECLEFLLGAVVTVFRQLRGRGQPPGLEVHLTHAPESGAPLAGLQAFFGSPVRHEAPYNGLVFHSAVLVKPIEGSDPRRCAELNATAEDALAAVPDTATFRRRVLDAARVALQEGDARLERVAEKLAMHPKRLVRGLQASGTSYRLVLAEVRMRLAERYLAQPEMSVGAVARLLGYSDRSAFNRAFRQWTGCSPNAYRSAVAESASPRP